MHIDTHVALRAAIVQALAVAALAIVLALVLSHGFFEDYGFIAGPLAWMLCAALTAVVLRLPLGLTLAGAALAGIPSALATVVGLHWAGAALAVIVFALWCGGVSARRAGAASVGAR
ncbi:MAG TPA: hypothetical protein VMT10_09700 [Solirubrobacteraceae bacterium]|nr:hypothetical protein [Solirubrobacteraceae bacterium]